MKQTRRALVLRVLVNAVGFTRPRCVYPYDNLSGGPTSLIYATSPIDQQEKLILHRIWSNQQYTMVKKTKENILDHILFIFTRAGRYCFVDAKPFWVEGLGYRVRRKDLIMWHHYAPTCTTPVGTLAESMFT